MNAAAATAADRRFMAAAIRLSRRHLGLTGTNPSVATLVVRDEGAGPVIVGRGVTAHGGRPHAETEALAEAGERARGATAYVTLEPCAHHGRTPPCAEALVTAGVSRVVGGASDPDARVSGRGYAILRGAGIEVVEGVLADEAHDEMAGYLIRSVSKRPQVTLKLAVSADGMIGRRGEGQVPVTGPVSRAQVQVMRAQSDAILVGIDTVIADDPQLTCRLPGLANRSPVRVVLDTHGRMPPGSVLARTAREVPVILAGAVDCDPSRRAALAALGVEFIATEMHEGHIALPELLEDMAARGISDILVEGGAAVARSFLEEGLVDRICLFGGPAVIGAAGIASPLLSGGLPEGFRIASRAQYGDDTYLEMRRTG